MNRILAVLIPLLVFGCQSSQQNRSNALKSENRESDLIIDTLVFDESMNGEELAKKYAHGLSELTFYKPFVSETKRLEKQIFTEEHAESEIIYLGKLMDLDSQSSYHVITYFKIIGSGEMESPRGRSHIAFLNGSLDKVIIYQVDMPDELPEKIVDNTLYFSHNSQQIGILIQGGLPSILCVPKIGCHE